MDELSANSASINKIVTENYNNSLHDEEINIILMTNNQYETLIGEMETNVKIDTASTKIKIGF